MKSKFWTGMGLLMMAALVFGQQAKPVPAFSTSDVVAISALEKTKQEAQKAYEDARQKELTILREFEASHPGFAVNQQTFEVQAVPTKADVKIEKVEPKAEPKKE